MTEDSEKVLIQAEKKLIDDFMVDVTDRLSRFFRRALIAITIIGLTSSLALVGFGYLLSKQHDASNQIQQQRYVSLVEQCQATNSRYLKVNKRIDEAVDKTPKQSAKEKQGTNAFRLIINAAVPYNPHCIATARSRIQGTGSRGKGTN